MGQAATVDWPEPAATMTSHSYGGHMNSQRNPYQPNPQQFSQSSSWKNEATSQLVAPSDILHLERPKQPAHGEPNPQLVGSMDKRHPSSFQQLEKVGHYNHYYSQSMLTAAPTAGRGDLCNGMRMTFPTPYALVLQY